jgi:predicted O-methyltransferase YrrM
MRSRQISFGRTAHVFKFFRSVWRERYAIRSILESGNIRFLRLVPPGHFYSPIPDIKEIQEKSTILFDRSKANILGIDGRLDAQIKLASEFAAYYKDIPFPDGQTKGCRYYLDNGYFSYGDGVTLYSMMRRFEPKRIIEVGSGFSSAAMLDVNDKFFNGSIEFTFIEPNPDRLFGLLGAQDKERFRVLQEPVQGISESIFANLRENDILFIDSSHVAKTGSDVLHLIFKILPKLNEGVIVHFHDILWPFEYPSLWLDQGRAWNEIYLVRAFLQYNSAFRILYFNSMMEIQHDEFLRREMPLAMKTPSSSIVPGNTSLWISKMK